MGVIRSQSSSIQILVVNGGTGVTYIGEAVSGTATSAARWRIRKLVDTSGDLAITFADGNKNMDNVWDDRASLTYS
jgi:hypothetical protein